MVRIGILGCAGRMGRANILAGQSNPDVDISCLWEAEGSEFIGADFRGFGIEKPGKVAAFPKGVEDVDVIIDFTAPLSTLSALPVVVEHKKALVIGTTGFDKEGKEEIAKASQHVPIVFAPNMSLGVNLLFALLKQAVSALPGDYEVEIIEAHHHSKKDAPSGTALKLWEIVKSERQLSDKDLACGREGIVGARNGKEVGMHSIRCADIVGEHTVILAAIGERIELAHKASSRLAFAKGAIKAAVFLKGKDNGLYDVRSVLGI